MRISFKDLRDIIRGSGSPAQAIIRLVEASDEGHVPFQQGAVMELHRPVRVTPIAHGEWTDLDTRGALGWEGGEDSPGARRSTRPRGITATILKPGTKCKVLKAGKNEAVCAPMEDDGSSVVDSQTGQPIKHVKIHINKFCPHCAKGYKAGKPKKPVGGVSPDHIAQLKARIAKHQAEVDALERGGQEEDPWAEKTDPDQV